MAPLPSALVLALKSIEVSTDGSTSVKPPNASLGGTAPRPSMASWKASDSCTSALRSASSSSPPETVTCTARPSLWLPRLSATVAPLAVLIVSATWLSAVAYRSDGAVAEAVPVAEVPRHQRHRLREAAGVRAEALQHRGAQPVEPRRERGLAEVGGHPRGDGVLGLLRPRRRRAAGHRIGLHIGRESRLPEADRHGRRSGHGRACAASLPVGAASGVARHAVLAPFATWGLAMLGLTFTAKSNRKRRSPISGRSPSYRRARPFLKGPSIEDRTLS
jgi:hypothetical protein